MFQEIYTYTFNPKEDRGTKLKGFWDLELKIKTGNETVVVSPGLVLNL